MKPGDRIELVSTDDPYTNLRPGARGTVRFVDDVGTVHVDWDSGSRLGLVAEAGDRWKELTDVCPSCGRPATWSFRAARWHHKDRADSAACRRRKEA